MPRVVHFEIAVGDPERAMRFYQSAFGWEFSKTPVDVDYWLVTTGPDSEQGINGGMMRREGPAQDGSPTAYVCTVGVPAIDEYAAKVKGSGGDLLTPKMTIPHVGWFFSCKDTEGNQFGIIQEDENAA